MRNSLFVLFLIVMVAPEASYALVSVTPDVVNIDPVNESLNLRAPYTDDDNGDCSLRVSWAVSGTDWGDESVQTVDIENQPHAFLYTIENLQNFTEYQVRIEFLDYDGSNNYLNVQTVPVIKPYNHLIHSSLTTGSLKWSASGGWGIPDTKYGEFACETCHKRKSGNIKRLKKGIQVTDATCLDQFPIEQAGGEVSFLTAAAGVSDFGDDQSDPPESSTKICEGCHSQNKFHNYNSLNNTGGVSHYNKDVCTSCHIHRNGFKVSCGGCHPDIPQQGSHDEHYNSLILGQELDCTICHATSVHRNALSEVRFDDAIAVAAGGAYSDQGVDETSCFDEIDGYCGSPVYGSCDNLYCHSNAAPYDKANAYKQPTWGGAALGCSSCHDSGGALSSLSGKHAVHTAADTYDFDCAKCHQDTVSDRNTVSSPEQHIDLEKDIAFAGGGTYNSAKACDNTYCHSDGRGGEPNVPVKWSDSGPLGCADCHDGRIGDASQMSSNAHLRLANEAWIREYPCEFCHYSTIDLAGNIKNYAEHVDEEKDIAFDPKWSIVGYPAPSYNSASMICDNLYCHSDGTAVTPQIRDFPWNLGEHAKCDSCHGHETDDNCLACHPDGNPVVNVEDQWKMSTPMYENTGPGTARANSHLRHLETEFACENCHRDTVVGSCGTAGCHDGGIPSGEMSEVGHVFANYHVNKIKDVTFKDGGSYDHATKTCSNTACHTGADPQWGESRNGEILCLSCHGTTEADVDDYGGFNGVQAKINMTEWVTSGHGRPTDSGPYTSGNPPANFPGNPCWYCHDNEVLHMDVTNPYRLKEHPQFENRFEKECVYCHMEVKDEECWACHDDPNSLSVNHQLENLSGVDPYDGLTYTVDHAPYAGNNVSCLTSQCHLPQQDNECRSCHDNPADVSGALQMDDSVVRQGMADETYVIADIKVGMSSTPFSADHIEFRTGGAFQDVSCMATPSEWPPTGCHSADVHIHNTDSGTWTTDQKADVKNQYVMMGVCLQCHDNDDNNRCNSCHTWSGAPEDNPYMLGYDPGTGYNSGSSHASSSHFGFKHFDAYEASQHVVYASGTLSTDSREDSVSGITYLVDDLKAWGHDELVGKSIKVTSGAHTGEVRLILTNTAGNMTVDGTYSSMITSGTTFDVLDTDWRGGKFCWDCHDPHGDSNIYMVHDEVSVKTDGLFGKPLVRAPVTFTRTLSGLDYAKSTAPFDGICNVCHTNVDHYHDDFGDAHRSGRRCTDCHEHGFGEGHGSGQSCDACHEQKPVPNHLGFGQPRDCTKCHDGAVNKRMDIMRQFRGQSHHVQGIDVTNEHCYECHWEATRYGLIDNNYHAGYNYKTYDIVLNAKSDLVIWEAGKRPDQYELGVTAAVFNATTIGSVDEREHVTNVTDHCISCHSDQNNDTDVFGDCKTPRQYAWDGTSIAARYSQEGTTNLGKYNTVTLAAQKVQTKAFSAHGKAVLNEGGWDPATGEDGVLPNTRNGTENVQCYDCHSSHGSYTTGVTSSYRTFDNSFGGANLKETQAGKGGYMVTYRAQVETNGSSIINPGANQCFDCHETRNVDNGTPSDSSDDLPWGYFETFGATEPVQGYRDSSRFDGLDNGVKVRFPYRAGKTGISGHYSHVSPPLSYSADEQLNGLCGGCHDPHGVSPTLGANQQYAVPLLKGTWLTSPYKEDSPQTKTTNNVSTSDVQIDRKTFNDLSNRTHITETDDQFAGLCLRCHPKDKLTDPYDPETGVKPPWTSMKRVHQSVKGWGSNQEHQFPCSKCHQPHSSGLQRLMRTNCLDWDHRGLLESGGATPGWYRTTQHYPRLNNRYQPCHQSAGAVGGTESSSNYRNQEWNGVTPW